MTRKKKKKKVMNAGHTKVRKGHYIRSDTGKTAKYSFKKDLKEKSRYISAKGKPMTGDRKKVLYNPRNPGQYIVLSEYDEKTGKMVKRKYGTKKEAVKHNKKFKKWKVGWA